MEAGTVGGQRAAETGLAEPRTLRGLFRYFLKLASCRSTSSSSCPAGSSAGTSGTPGFRGSSRGGATAAAVGAIAGAAIVIAGQVIEDAGSIVIAVIALAVLLQPKVKVPEPVLVTAAALAGLALFS